MRKSEKLDRKNGEMKRGGRGERGGERPALHDEMDGWQRDGWRDQRENLWKGGG